MSCTGQLLPQALAPRPSEQTPAAIPAPPPPPPPQRTMQLYSRLGKIASKPAPVLKRQQHNSLARLVALLAPRGDRGAGHTRSAPERPTESGPGSRWRLSVIVISSSAVCGARGWAPMAMSSGTSSAGGRSVVCVARERLGDRKWSWLALAALGHDAYQRARLWRSRVQLSGICSCDSVPDGDQERPPGAHLACSCVWRPAAAEGPPSALDLAGGPGPDQRMRSSLEHTDGQLCGL